VTMAASAAPPLCKCAMPARQAITKKAGANQGRPFWTCAATDNQGCKFFEWAGPQVATPSQPAAAPRPSAAPPERVDGQCGQCRAPVMHQRVSMSNTKGNAGRQYYVCSACGSFKWLTPESAPSGAAQPGLNFFAVTDAETLRRLQALLTVPSSVKLGRGRDYVHSGRHSDDYDYIEVVNAWRVINKAKQARFDAFKTSVCARAPLTMRAAHAEAAAALRSAPAMRMGAAHGQSNEVLLLHGTKPQHLYSLLFEGLDPQVSADGLFGRGGPQPIQIELGS
jgi:hypothetical protein